MQIWSKACKKYIKNCLLGDKNRYGKNPDIGTKRLFNKWL